MCLQFHEIFLEFSYYRSMNALKKIMKKQVYETKNVLPERILKSEGAYRPAYLS